ncbi:Uncharacterised protein [Mycobacteroides abscessus subsp. abscessus]|nr:Uncharacterised protein [Mycobacteroides abscessus subsp. abscessus]
MAGLPNDDAGIDDGTHVYLNNATKFATRDQDTVTQELKDQVEGSPNPLQAFVNFFFSSIMAGFANLTDVIENIVHAITGAAGGTLATLTTFMSGLVGNVADTITNLSNLIYNLANNAASVIGAIPQALVTGLTGALADVNSFVQQVVDGIMTAIRGVPFVGGSIANMIASLTGYKSGVETVQSQTKQFVVSSTAGVTRQPGWASAFSISSSTYPAILNSDFDVFADSIGPATAGTAHTHPIRGVDSVSAIAPWWNYTKDQAIGGFISVTEDTVFSGFQFAAYADTAPALSDVAFEVFRELPDGSLVMLTTTDVGTSLTTSSKLISLSWSSYRLVAQRGERYMVRLRNKSSGTNGIHVRGLSWGFGVPEIQFETDTLADTNKTSYTAAQKNTIISNSAVTPWFTLTASFADIPESFTWVDDFERGDLGYFWSQSLNDTGGDLVISGGNLAYGGTTNGWQQALYIRSIATDQFKMEANVPTVGSNGVVAFFMGADRESANGAVLAIANGSVQLASLVNGVQTVRANVTRTGNAGKWTVTYNSTTKVYSVYFNDVAVSGLTWTDSGGVVPQGSLYRFGHIQIMRTSGVNGGTVSDWLMQDWRP